MAKTKIDTLTYELAHGRKPHPFNRGVWDFAATPPPAPPGFTWHGPWWEARAEALLWAGLQAHPAIWLL